MDTNSSASSPVKLAIFASGSGSNAQRFIEYFREHNSVQVRLVVSNKPDAGVVKRAEAASIPVLQITRDRFVNGDGFVSELTKAGINWVILAGFLWKIPPALIAAYPRRIVNIHPALLPDFGGKGMYGNFVHEAVLTSGSSVSGITIHYVDEHYDHGDVIFQTACPILPNDTPETLASRIHGLEHAHFAPVIEQLIITAV